jgi:integrase
MECGVDRFAKRCPEVPKDDLEASREAGIFLAELALKHNLASASIDQARNSLAWLFRRQMGFDFVLPDKGTAHRGRRIPQVISSAKVRDLLAHCEDPWDLFFSLQYGCGLRLMELLEMRIQEVDLDRRVLTVRHGKGDVDRQCLLPQALHQRIGLHLGATTRGLERGSGKGACDSGSSGSCCADLHRLEMATSVRGESTSPSSCIRRPP